MDARQRRTRARLARTILQLAAERPTSEISVSEIAAQAGINRSTFYQHAAAPCELLESVLAEELTELSLTHLSTVSTDDAAAVIARVTVATLRHLDERADVYRVGLGDDVIGASLQPMLNRIFTATILDVFERGAITFPHADCLNEEQRELFVRSAALFVAAGSVATFRVWLDTPAPRDIASFLEVTSVLLPSWWPFDLEQTSALAPADDRAVEHQR
ncbi:transcriptional regulator, TetR family [Plantibacter flavus]|uniref:TetR family transcriptional regulator n=1 Tax=Plantibacter flavus TaxID=150123 RepID=A0A3N2C3T2_9MICO|nr:TetR family transcriptional regulator [Plantibacter flavus]ROR82100.1 TetR family transcriptional regulator [Plantibacter flavus]SMG51352.1 transcriptional regulator, TetR family [Plantibacter flavus]